MSVDISGFGLQINLIASNTYPVGVILTQFADDADPFDLPSLQIADKAMGLNGDLVGWSKANPTIITMNLIAGSDDDETMNILLQANRVGKGKIGAKDKITLTGIYPDGTFITAINGLITDGIPGKSVSSAGRYKSRSYSFAFENYVGI